MSENQFDVLLAGNHLTTMIAACKLALSGKRVCLFNPTKNWGGHFTRLTVGGMPFDPGAVSHEFTAFNADDSKKPLCYDPRKRNDVGRFISLIEDFTRSHIPLNRMPEPQLVYEGKIAPDIIMSNRLELLKHPKLALRVFQEQCHIASGPESLLHPRMKKASPLFLESSYYDVSLMNHGATLHSEIFEPVFYKMSANSTTRLISLYHRIAWLPLYYPETLLSQYGPHPQTLQETSFYYPSVGHIGALAESLLSRILEAGVTIVTDGIEHLQIERKQYEIRTRGNDCFVGSELGWSLSHDLLYQQATGQPKNQFEKWSVLLVFLTIPIFNLKQEFSVLYVPDSSILFYRASNQTVSSGLHERLVRIVVEVNPEYAERQGYVTDAAITEQVIINLVSLGIFHEVTKCNIVGVKTLQNALLLPSKENWELLKAESDVLMDAYPGVQFTRNVEAFFTDTLNDQIIKGLKLADQFSASL